MVTKLQELGNQTQYLTSSFIAFSTGALLCPQYVAIHLEAVTRPKFSGPRSASIAQSQLALLNK